MGGVNAFLPIHSVYISHIKATFCTLTVRRAAQLNIESFVTDTQKRKIDEILKRIDEVYNEATSLSDELKLILRDVEVKRFATIREINKLPEEVQDSMECRYTNYKMRVAENDLKSSLDCIFHIHRNCNLMKQYLDDFKDRVTLYYKYGN